MNNLPIDPNLATKQYEKLFINDLEERQFFHCFLSSIQIYCFFTRCESSAINSNFLKKADYKFHFPL